MVVIEQVLVKLFWRIRGRVLSLWKHDNIAANDLERSKPAAKKELNALLSFELGTAFKLDCWLSYEYK